MGEKTETILTDALARLNSSLSLSTSRCSMASPLVLPEILARPPKPRNPWEFEPQSRPNLSAVQDNAMPWITLLLQLVDALVTERSRLILENLALRQQVAVLNRSVKRAKVGTLGCLRRPSASNR